VGSKQSLLDLRLMQ